MNKTGHKSHLSQANGGGMSKTTGKPTDQGKANGGAKSKMTPSARFGGANATRDKGNAGKAGDNTTPRRGDVAPKMTAERGGGGRKGHTAGMRVGRPSGSHLTPPGKV